MQGTKATVADGHTSFRKALRTDGGAMTMAIVATAEIPVLSQTLCVS